MRVTVAHPPAGARDFAWAITGRGARPSHIGASAHAEVVFASAGVHVVAVRFSAGGQTRFGVLTLTVAPAPARERASARRAAPVALDTRVTPDAAGDPPVAVADFHFSPAATTIHVGDTVTWTNNGPSSHTATARNGGFDTGVLKKGQSASHTFTQTGTFTYFCQIHPFMHGTIVVQAATPSTTPAAATTPAATTAAATPAVTTAATPPTSTAAAVPTGPTLPNTGFNVLGGLFAGLLLVGVGAALRQTRSR
ncbi:MAG: cupredoxin family copper-binding protein [Solirubrobacteraceae bacterium]